MPPDEPRFVVSELDLGASHLCHVTYAPGAEFDTHRHERACLSLIVDGDYMEWMGCGPRRVRRHAVRRYGAGSTHAARIGARGARVVNLTDPNDREWRSAPSPHAHGLLWQIAKELDGTETFDDMSRLHLESLVHELQGGKSFESPEWLDTIVAFLREDPTVPWTLTELGRSVSVHPAHLARAFKNRLGMTVGEFVRRLRVARAATELRRSGANLAWVALEAGFYDQSHMGKWFRRYLGATPQDMLRRHRTSGGWDT